MNRRRARLVEVSNTTIQRVILHTATEKVTLSRILLDLIVTANLVTLAVDERGEMLLAIRRQGVSIVSPNASTQETNIVAPLEEIARIPLFEYRNITTPELFRHDIVIRDIKAQRILNSGDQVVIEWVSNNANTHRILGPIYSWYKLS